MYIHTYVETRNAVNDGIKGSDPSDCMRYLKYDMHYLNYSIVYLNFEIQYFVLHLHSKMFSVL